MENDFVLWGILGSKGKSQRVLEEHKTRFAAPPSLGSVADFYLQEAENRSEKDWRNGSVAGKPVFSWNTVEIQTYPR